MAVVEHGPVGHPLVAVGEVLQVLVVGGDDRPRTFCEQLLQHGLGQRTTDARLCACAELVDEDERTARGLPHHVLHVEQMGGVGGEVVLQALLIANVYHHITKHAAARALPHGNGHPTLQHVLQEAYRLEADRLATGIGA